jgi:hypothetical protein
VDLPSPRYSASGLEFNEKKEAVEESSRFLKKAAQKL